MNPPPTSLPTASLWAVLYRTSKCWEPAWGTPPMAKVMRKETSAGLSLRRLPVPKCLPSIPESVLCSHLHLWLYRGLSPITISLREGVNLQLQVNKNSWAWQVFQLTDSSEGSLACLSGFIWPHVIVYRLPTVRGMRCFKLSIYTDSFEKLENY